VLSLTNLTNRATKPAPCFIFARCSLSFSSFCCCLSALL
jgi:hypothetical protein